MILLGLSYTMPAEVKCPSCGRPVLTGHRFCEHCESDLVVATLLAELQALLPIHIPEGTPIAPELLVPRIGDYLIEREILRPSQLQAALEYQRSRYLEQQPLLLGQALLELGMITREALDETVTAQILELHNKINEANLSLKQRIEERTVELRQALEQLTELNQLKANFIANISHELRTPLTQIKGYLDIVSDEALGTLNTRQKEAISVVKKAEERLERLIDDLIQFSLVSRGDLSLNMHQVDPIGLIRSSVERSRTKAAQLNIDLKVENPQTLPSFYADEDKLGWVLNQLLDNALKFTAAGGTVCIGCYQVDDGMVGFSVKDTGIGIPGSRINEIFEPFHQLDGSTTRKYTGTGLGLAMVRKIIEAHGSQINVQSEVGHGSTFDFQFPIHVTVPTQTLQSSKI
jgi:signal transduction histidine kinase